jgi:hypothetical protein
VSPQLLRQLVADLKGAIDDPEQSAWGANATGADSSLVQTGLIKDVLRATPLTIEGSDKTQLEKVATTVDTLNSLQPRDTAEGMLAAQMVATHKAAMEMLGLAMLNRTKPQTVDVLLRNATRLMALHAKQQDMLERRRARSGVSTTQAEPERTPAASEAPPTPTEEAGAAAPPGAVVRAKFGT